MLRRVRGTAAGLPAHVHAIMSVPPEAAPKDLRGDIAVGLVCHSNLNRSMEAHDKLHSSGFACRSYGVGSRVKLPGESKDEPNVYEFGVPYGFILEDLRRKNEDKYTRNNMLRMVERNARIKRAPERWQEERQARFDLVICFEQRVFDIVVDDIKSRESARCRPVHVVNIETKDTHETAVLGANAALRLVQRLYAAPDWEDSIEAVLDELESNGQGNVLHAVLFY